MADVFDQVLGRGVWRRFCRQVNERGGWRGQFPEDGVKRFLEQSAMGEGVTEEQMAQLIAAASEHKQREKEERAHWQVRRWEDELVAMERRHADQVVDLKNEIAQLEAANKKLENALAASSTALSTLTPAQANLESTKAATLSLTPCKVPKSPKGGAARPSPAAPCLTPQQSALKAPRNEVAVTTSHTPRQGLLKAGGTTPRSLPPPQQQFQKSDTHRSVTSTMSTPRSGGRKVPHGDRAFRRTATSAVQKAPPLFSSPGAAAAGKAFRRSHSGAHSPGGSSAAGFESWRLNKKQPPSPAAPTSLRGLLYEPSGMLGGPGGEVSQHELVGYFAHLERTIAKLDTDVQGLQNENGALANSVEGMEQAVCQAALYASQRSKMLHMSGAIWKAHESVRQQALSLYQDIEVRPHKRLELLHGLAPILYTLDANISLSKSMLSTLFTENELQHCGIRIPMAAAVLINEHGEARGGSRARSGSRGRQAFARSSSVGSRHSEASSSRRRSGTQDYHAPSSSSPPGSLLREPHRVTAKRPAQRQPRGGRSFP
eukprot:TRINITY_DN5268_c0_g1_i1.p1 TRINITY_DN5268_c0_g1~~TRINITY_DN5268_c0_g1_i1.p1  ORF type:complete len:544 (+),score=200.17 TRINITY_DN5268_c0_g1_i1:161-1792(+)